MPIGLVDENDQIAEVSLGDSVFNLGFSWNEEGQIWTMSLRDLNFELLASGIAVVSNVPLLRQFRRPEFPPGEFAVDSNPNKSLNRQSFFDGSATLYYVFPEEMA